MAKGATFATASATLAEESTYATTPANSAEQLTPDTSSPSTLTSVSTRAPTSKPNSKRDDGQAANTSRDRKLKMF